MNISLYFRKKRHTVAETSTTMSMPLQPVTPNGKKKKKKLFEVFRDRQQRPLERS